MPRPAAPKSSTPSAGFALPALAARVSEAAGGMRTASISASLGCHELRPPRPPVDQQQVNCCVSCALGAAMEIINPGSPSLAPLFHYYVTRFQRFGATADGSLDLDVALDVLTNEGICRRILHDVPFSEGGAQTQPSEAAFADGISRALGLRDLLLRYEPVTVASRAAWAREQLRNGKPVVMGFILPLTYDDQKKNRNFVWRDQENFVLSNTGHCVLVTGYNDAMGALHIRDSRGTSAFDAGYWWMGYRVADSSIVQSMYCLVP